MKKRIFYMDKNAELCYDDFIGGGFMIWDGSSKDTTNFSTAEFLKINSAGFQNPLKDYRVIREKGRVDYHILFINGGSCKALHGTTYHSLNSGDFIVYAPGEKQEYFFDADSSTTWCHFTGNAIEEILSSVDIKSGAYHADFDKRIFYVFSKLIRRFHQPGRERIANASMLELIYTLAEVAKASDTKKYTEEISSVMLYINKNYNREITIDKLAEIAGYSKSRFSHIFSEITGTTPKKYQNNLRLDMACEILSSTSRSVTEVAYDCGFNDPLYFSRAFKRKYGVCPSEYQKNLN